MKKMIFLMLLMLGLTVNVNAQGWYSGSSNSGYSQHQSHNATITIVNRSEYTLTIKVMYTGGRGLYRTVYISPKSSSAVSFSRSDNFYYKAKAEKSGLLGETLYRKGGVFSVECDESGYTEGTLEFYVSSSGSGSSGQGISRAEFEKNE